MELFIIYIGKVAICLGIFLAIYILFLRNTTFLLFNRIYLLIGFLVSLLFPLIKPTYDVILTASIPMNQINPVDLTDSGESQSVNLWLLLGVVYVIGLFLFIVRNIYSYLKIGKLIKDGRREIYRSSVVVDNKSIQSPFSFLSYILLNSNSMSEKERELIIKHEQIHIEQRHWIDLLCSECMLLLQWFNPLAWIYVRLLKENHEFLADRAVLDSGVSPYIYQAVLVNQEFKGPVFSFTNSFNYSKSLNRLSMMKKEKSASWRRLTVLAIVPMFGLFLWASAEPNYIVDSRVDGSIGQDTVVPEDTVSKNVMEDEVVVIGYGKQTSKRKVKDSVSRGKDALIIVDVKKAENIDTLKSENTASKNILKDEVIVIGYGKRTIPFEVDSQGNMQDPDMKDALLLVDGKEVSSINDIKPEDIESISVLKGKSATDIYGEKGGNGVVLVTTKKDKVKKDGYSVSGLKNALFIVDGKEVSSIDDIKHEDVESVSVLKDKSATDIYGEKGRNGVLLIETKKK